MNLLSKLILTLILTIFATAAIGADDDIAQLNNAVNLKAQQIESLTGILPTNVELETIQSDLVFDEIQSTDLTTEQAIQKYELTPSQSRYLKIKAVMLESESSDAIRPCPCP